RGALLRERRDERLERDRLVRVEPVQRLVEEDDLRAVEQCGDDHDLLPRALRVRRELLLLEEALVELEELAQLAGARRRVGDRQAVELGDERQVLLPGERLED